MGLEQISEFFVDNLVLMIVVIYMTMMIAIGYFVQRKGADKSAENYRIANKGVGPLMVGGTVFSTNWCGGVLLGAAGTAYTGYVVSTIADPWGHVPDTGANGGFLLCDSAQTEDCVSFGDVPAPVREAGSNGCNPDVYPLDDHLDRGEHCRTDDDF